MSVSIDKSNDINSGDEPYSALADIYDDLMDHVDYHSWALYIDKILKTYGPVPATILELACGTGSLSLELHDLGYLMFGSDLSPGMLQHAARKFRSHDMPVRLVAASMTSLPLRHSFDAVVCLYDSVNYLTSEEDFGRMLQETSKNLANGGLFIFDVCTVKNSEMFFSDHSMVEQYGDIRCERVCVFDREKRIQENHFTLHKNGHCMTESHYQKIYRLHEIESMILREHFLPIGRFNDMSFMHGNEESERVHYVLRKR